MFVRSLSVLSLLLLLSSCGKTDNKAAAPEKGRDDKPVKETMAQSEGPDSCRNPVMLEVQGGERIELDTLVSRERTTTLNLEKLDSYLLENVDGVMSAFHGTVTKSNNEWNTSVGCREISGDQTLSMSRVEAPFIVGLADGAIAKMASAQFAVSRIGAVSTLVFEAVNKSIVMTPEEKAAAEKLKEELRAQGIFLENAAWKISDTEFHVRTFVGKKDKANKTEVEFSTGYKLSLK